MKNASIALLVIAFVVIMAGSALIWHVSPGRFVADLGGKIFSPVAASLHHSFSFIAAFAGRRDLVRENARLQESLLQAQTDAASRDALEQENAFLRAAAGLKERVGRQQVMGAVFSYIRDGGVQQMVVNRGTQDGVVAGDIAVTSAGALIGVVQDSGTHHAVIRALGDPSLEVTGRIVGSEVSGLVRVSSTQELLLDLVQKSETVTEGQTVVTSGNDQFPAGLIIGTVRSVDADTPALFKVVRIALAIPERFDGRIVILKP